MTCATIPKSTSSPALADGPTPSPLQAGHSTVLCGPAPVHANPSATLASAGALPTNAISGLSSHDLSPSAALQRSLESRLQARLAVYGSLEYALTWKQWDMPAGPPICALRASARRTSDNGCGGWPSPKASDATGAGTRGYGGENLQTVAGWATTTARDWKDGRASKATMERNARPLNEQVVGWVSPTAQDHSRGNRPPRPHDSGVPLSQQVAWASGPTTSSSPAQTGKRGALSPVFSLWLMGYGVQWYLAASTIKRKR